VQFPKLTVSCTGDDMVTVRAGSNSSAPVIWQSCYVPPMSLPATVWDDRAASLAVGGTKVLFVTFTSGTNRDSGYGAGWNATVSTFATPPSPLTLSACPGPVILNASDVAGASLMTAVLQWPRGCAVYPQHVCLRVWVGVLARSCASGRCANRFRLVRRLVYVLLRRLCVTVPANLTDGSGVANYANNLNCSWLLRAPSGSRVQLNITTIALEAATICPDW
jgi:hypothetical protein